MKKIKRFFNRLRFWLFRRNKHCKKCCLNCAWYFLCSGEMTKAIESVNDTVERFVIAVSKFGVTLQDINDTLTTEQEEGEQ